jgi:hypothetical protein
MAEDITIAPAPDAAGADDAVSLPNPLSAEGNAADMAADKAAADRIAAEKAEAEKADAEPAKKRTVRDSVEAAAKAVEAKEQGDDKTDKEKPEAKADDDTAAQSTGKDRDEKGKFVAKADPGKPAAANKSGDAPERFVPEAKADWTKTPDTVKAEVHRTIKNLESGLQEHQKRWEPLKEYDDLARKSGTTIDRALKEYVGIDKLLGENFVAGMQRIAANKGIDLRSFAADVLNLSPQARQQLQVTGQPQQVQTQSANEIALQRRIDQLEAKLNGVSSTQQQQTEQQINAELADFAKDKPLFNELANEIAFYIRTEGLHYTEAYDKAVQVFEEKAKRAGFITQQQAAPAPRGQPSAGTRSIKGAPGPGSSPVNFKRSSSIREAIERAAARAG